MRKSPFSENHFLNETNTSADFFIVTDGTKPPKFWADYYCMWSASLPLLLTLMGELARVSAHPMRVRAFHSPDTTMKAPQKGVGLVFKTFLSSKIFSILKFHFYYVKIFYFY